MIVRGRNGPARLLTLLCWTASATAGDGGTPVSVVASTEPPAAFAVPPTRRRRSAAAPTELRILPKKKRQQDSVSDEDIERSYFSELMGALLEPNGADVVRRTQSLTQIQAEQAARNKRQPVSPLDDSRFRRGSRLSTADADDDLLVVPSRRRSTSFMIDADPPSDLYNADAYRMATDLVNAVLDPKKRTPTKTKRIETLVQKLTASFDRIRYDPDECLYGPFYANLYSYTPNGDTQPEDRPLWETLSALQGANIKGQQYWKDDNAELTGQVTGNVLSYSEVLGPAFHLRANGVFEPKQQPNANGSSSSANYNNNNNNNNNSNNNSNAGKSWLDSLLGRTDSTQNEPEYAPTIRQCPDVYQFRVRSASVHAMGTSLSLPIRGSSEFVILYADPRVRILLNTDKAPSNWSTQGLIVVQIRSDLVPENIIGSDGRALDMRQ